jgi:large subunit ribosomal protein L18
MSTMEKKVLRRRKLRYSIRKKIAGTALRPRLSVFRSNKEIYAQIINDEQGITLTSASSVGIDKAGKNKIDIAKIVGQELSAKAKAAGIETVVFDRGGYLYHGRVKSLADGAREGGLIF